jgi:hypothetical protein
MLDIFQSGGGERARQIRFSDGEPSPHPAGELDATCGFAPKFQTEDIRDLVGNSSRTSQCFDMDLVRILVRK